MEPTLKNFRNALETFQKEIELENQAFMNSVKMKLLRMNNSNVSRKMIREFFGTGAGMLQWEGHKNKIRRLTADFISSVSELSYYKGIVSNA